MILCLTIILLSIYGSFSETTSISIFVKVHILAAAFLRINKNYFSVHQFIYILGMETICHQLP